jgi:DNA-binding transcriptional LysR family regulator
MDVDTRLLRYFAAIAEEGNLTRAAHQHDTHRSRAHPRRTNAAGSRELGRRSARNEKRRPCAARRFPVQRGERGHTGHRRRLRETQTGLARRPAAGAVVGSDGEPRHAALSSSHPLARRHEIAFPELWDEAVVVTPALKGNWRDHWLATSERDGREVRIGAVIERPDEFLSAIADGHGIALFPASAALVYARPGVVYVPVTGVSASEVGVAWLPDAGEAVADFVRCCLDVTRSRRTGCGTRWD